MARFIHYLLLVLVGVTLLVGILLGYWYLQPIYQLRSLKKEVQEAVDKGELDRAHLLLKELHQREPEDAHWHLLHATVLRRKGDYAQADYQLNQAGMLGLPKEEGMREAGLFLAISNFPDAIGALRAELEKTPNDPELLKALAEGFAKMRLSAEADRYFKLWVERAPDDLDARLERGEMYLESNRFREAELDFREIIRRSPRHFRARIMLCQTLLADARLREAEPELLMCKELRPDSPDPLIGLSACAVERQDFEKARTLLFQATELDPGSIQALTEIGNLHMHTSRPDLAVTYFERVIRLDKRAKQAHLKLSMAYRALGNAEQAIKAVD
jgi:Flp pilus assembly protein TadD